MHIVSPCVRPKRAHKEGIHIFAALLACPRGPKYSRKTDSPTAPTVFGARLGSLWVSVGDFWLFLSLDDHFEIIVESLWMYEGPFSKNIHFQIDLNHFTRLRFEFWIYSGLLWGHFLHLKQPLGPLCGYFGVTLGI